MNIALRANANTRIVCADDQGNSPLIANRSSVGPWEEFHLLVRDGDEWVPLDLPALVASIVAGLLPAAPIVPKPHAIAPWDTFQGSAQEWFSQLVYGKPFGQATLLALEPTLNANGWQLTPPNAVGDRTKVGYPWSVAGGPTEVRWVRVGFGESHWVWVVQA